MGREFLKVATLCLLTLVLLGFGLGKSGVAGVFNDPVSGLRAQDETTYASSAATVANRGEWLTPKVLGRYLLVKPPLLIWLAGLSLKLFGASTTALRLPVLFAAVFATLILFLWVERAHSFWVAVLAWLLLISNPLWHILSRICYTDMLLACAMTGALGSLAMDPAMAKWRTVVVFAAFTAVGIMAKNAAGLLPVFVLLAFCSLLPSEHRPRMLRLVEVCALIALLVAPWHLYQFISHPRWFWTDYVQIQLLQFGLAPPAQPSPEGPVVFYGKRLFLMDPLLCLLVLTALPAFVRGVRDRRTEALLLACWLTMSIAALLAFRYRNLPYLLYTIPPLCLVAAGYGPLSRGKFSSARWRTAAGGALIAVFCCKVALADQVWGLRYGEESPIPSAEALRRYAQLRRPNELIVVSPDDEFYAAVLPLPKLRYCFIDPAGVATKYAPHYAYLGITLSVAQFVNLENETSVFRRRLRQWGLNSIEPLGTTIVADSRNDVMKLIETHPQSDFYLPADLSSDLATSTRASWRAISFSRDRVFLLAREIPQNRIASTESYLLEAW